MRLRYALPLLACCAAVMVTGVSLAQTAPDGPKPGVLRPPTAAEITKRAQDRLRRNLDAARKAGEAQPGANRPAGPKPKPKNKPANKPKAKPPRPTPPIPAGSPLAPPASATPSPANPPPSFETGLDIPTKPMPPRSKITFNLEEATLQDLVRLISSITGKRFIVPGKVRQIKATVFAPKKVTAAEAYRAFLSILELNGLALVPSGRYLKIVESSGIEARTIPLYVDDEVPRDDRFLTHLHRVDNVAAEDVANLLGRFKSREGNITAYAPTNTLIMTDTGANIRRMKRIVTAIDVARGGEQMWIEPVHHANAGELASRLAEIFPVDSGGGSKKPRRKTPRKKPGKKGSSPTPSAPETVGNRSGDFRVSQILPDERTNSLIILATETAYLRVLELIRHLDIPLDGEGGIHVHYLQHGDAKDISQTLSTLIGGGRRGGGKKGGKGASKGGGAGAGGVFEGQIAVTAHEPTNSLVITSSLHDYAALRRVIDRLDSERRQVFIEAAVMDLNISRGRNLGLKFHGGVAGFPEDESIMLFGNEAASTLTPGVSPELLTGLAVGVRGPNIPDSANLIGVGVPAFGVALTALSNSSNTNVLATPHLIAMDNEEAEINIGQNVPLQGNAGLGALGGLAGLAGAGGGQNTSGAAGLAGALGGLGGLGGLGAGAVPRRDVGTRIRITPHINESDEIRLEIDEEISELGATVPGNANAAVINRRTAKTQVVVRDQQTVVIGGLVRDSVLTAETKVPILGDIPLLGALFRQTQKDTAKTNLLLFLTPYIIRSQADLRSIYERKLRERQEFIDRYFVFGSRDYTPPVDYSRTRGLLAEILTQVDDIREERRIIEEAAAQPPPQHVPRQPVGTFRRASEAGDDVVISDGEIAPVEGGEEPPDLPEPPSVEED